jgi:hypothetical protein
MSHTIASSDPDFSELDPVTEERAESAMVLGVIAMGLGIAGLTCLPFRVFFEAIPPSREGLPPVGYKEAIFPVIGLLLSVLLTAGGYAAFRRKRWARPALLVYAVCTLVAGVLSFIFYGREHAHFRQGLIERGGGVAFTFELTMWLFGIGFSIYLLYGMTRGKVRRVLTE